MNAVSDIRFNCPNCSQHLVADPDMRGDSIDCPACHRPITIPSFTEVPDAMATNTSPPISTFVSFPCPQCERELYANHNFFGKQIECHHCHSLALVPFHSVPTNEVAIKRRLEEERRAHARLAEMNTSHTRSPSQEFRSGKILPTITQGDVSTPSVHSSSAPLASAPQSTDSDSGALLAGLITLLKLAGIGMHLWTVVLAYDIDGVLGAVVSFVFPILAELFYFFSMISHTNTLFNPYSTALIAYVFCYGFAFLFSMAISDRNDT